MRVEEKKRVSLRIVRLQRLYDQTPPQWEGRDEDNTPVYMIFHKGYLSIRRGYREGGLESAQVGDEVFGRQVDIGWNPAYPEIRRLCEGDVTLPETDHGHMGSEGVGNAAQDSVSPGSGVWSRRLNGAAELSGHGPASRRLIGGGGPSISRPREPLKSPVDRQEGGGATEKPGRGSMSPARLLASWTGSSAEPAERRTFSDRLNLNRMRFEKLRAVTDRAVNERQLQILQSMFGKSRFEVFIWEEDSGSIPDTEELKLVVLAKEDPYHIRDIVRNCGIKRRANRNTLFFLYPSELVRRACINTIRYALACEALASDGTLSLSEEARREVAEETVKQGAATWDSVRKLYRALGIPGLEQRRTIDLGIPPHGSRSIDEQIYGRLVSDGLVLEYVDPLMMRDEHLKDEAFILTEELYRSFLRIPGKPRLANRAVLEVAISRGVETGVFGLGQLVGAQPLCRAFMERPSEVTLRGREVIMREGLCKPVAIR